MYDWVTRVTQATLSSQCAQATRWCRHPAPPSTARSSTELAVSPAGRSRRRRDRDTPDIHAIGTGGSQVGAAQHTSCLEGHRTPRTRPGVSAGPAVVSALLAASLSRRCPAASYLSRLSLHQMVALEQRTSNMLCRGLWILQHRSPRASHAQVQRYSARQGRARLDADYAPQGTPTRGGGSGAPSGPGRLTLRWMSLLRLSGPLLPGSRARRHPALPTPCQPR